MDYSKLSRVSRPAPIAGRPAVPGMRSVRPVSSHGPVVPPGYRPAMGLCGMNPAVQPRLITFQPLVTVFGVGMAPPAFNMEVQPYSDWLDALGVTTLQFKVEVWKLDYAKLILESSMFPEEDIEQWEEIKSWTTAPDPLEIVTAASDSKQYIQAGIDRVFSRYVRWRVTSTGNDPWEACFRVKALAGASFTSWPEKPRLV